MATVLHPKGNRITVLRDAEKNKTAGGIEIPDNVKATDHCVGTVLEVGPGVAESPGPTFASTSGESWVAVKEPQFKTGDRVLYSRYAGIDMMVGGQAICVLQDNEIIGVLEGEGE